MTEVSQEVPLLPSVEDKPLGLSLSPVFSSKRLEQGQVDFISGISKSSLKQLRQELTRNNIKVLVWLSKTSNASRSNAVIGGAMSDFLSRCPESCSPNIVNFFILDNRSLESIINAVEG